MGGELKAYADSHNISLNRICREAGVYDTCLNYAVRRGRISKTNFHKIIAAFPDIEAITHSDEYLSASSEELAEVEWITRKCTKTPSAKGGTCVLITLVKTHNDKKSVRMSFSTEKMKNKISGKYAAIGIKRNRIYIKVDEPNGYQINDASAHRCVLRFPTDMIHSMSEDDFEKMWCGQHSFYKANDADDLYYIE